jgi:predicted naringenin-chalcone synthase
VSIASSNTTHGPLACLSDQVVSRSSSTTHLLGMGFAVPNSCASQARTATYAIELSNADHAQARRLKVLYERSGVKQRHAVVLNELGERWFFRSADEVPTTKERMELYGQLAGPLAVQAAARALEEAAVEPASITHIVVASCTGMGSPGVDCVLIESLKLSPSVSRTHIGFMGCHAAINALAVAHAFSRADSSARVLVVCVELCSLHFHYNSTREGQEVANALFSDGAAAAVIGQSAHNSGQPAGDKGTPPRIAGFTSVLWPQTAEEMSWSIGNHGFEMGLRASVPAHIESGVSAWLAPWLSKFRLAVPDIQGWAVHPGGPRILSATTAGLGLESSACDASREVLKNYGNMSSPTVLFVLQSMLSRPGPWVALAFGPGLVGEACLLL